jgi:hypothetical protein
MPQSLAQIYLHNVFSTKDRRPFLSDRTLREEMHRVLGDLCNKLNYAAWPVSIIASIALTRYEKWANGSGCCR